MIPDYPRIYLQPNEAGIGRHTWCQDRIEDTDIEYIRADIADEMMASLQRLLERMRQTLDHAQATGPNPTSQRALEYRLAEAINALSSLPTQESEDGRSIRALSEPDKNET